MFLRLVEGHRKPYETCRVCVLDLYRQTCKVENCTSF